MHQDTKTKLSSARPNPDKTIHCQGKRRKRHPTSNESAPHPLAKISNLLFFYSFFCGRRPLPFGGSHLPALLLLQTGFNKQPCSRYGVGLASADRLPVVVRIPASPFGSLKCDPPKGNGRRPQKKSISNRVPGICTCKSAAVKAASILAKGHCSISFSEPRHIRFLCPSPLSFSRSTVLEIYSSTTSRSGESIRSQLSMHGPETGIIPLRDEIA